MTRLTALELSLRHGNCSQSGCPICAELPMGKIASYMNRVGFHVRNYSEDHKTGFAFVEVQEDADTCSRLLRVEKGKRSASEEGRPVSSVSG